MNLAYRQAVEADREIIRSILTSQKLPSESIGTGITDFYLALDNNTVVGVAGFEYYGEDALLRSVAVPSQYQKKGIGFQFVDWMIALGKQKRLKSMVLLTETASNFFAKKGFSVVGRSSINNEALKKSSQFCGGCCSSAACMKLDL
jgi:N-acetylglutamate synthase and related acetyltransferases